MPPKNPMKPATPSTPGEQAKVYMSNKHEIMVVKVTQDHYESGPKLHKYITAMITDDKEMTQLKTEIIAHCKAMTAPPIMKRKFSETESTEPIMNRAIKSMQDRKLVTEDAVAEVGKKRGGSKSHEEFIVSDEDLTSALVDIDDKLNELDTRRKVVCDELTRRRNKACEIIYETMERMLKPEVKEVKEAAK